MRPILSCSAILIVLGAAACGGDEGQSVLGSVAVGDTTRTFVLHVPPDNRLTDAVPLLLVFHGSGSSGAAMQQIAGLDRLADELGFLVAYPDAEVGNWAEDCGCNNADRLGINDTGFVRALIDSLSVTFSIDRDRLYAAGLSQGGLFVHRLACQLGDRFAAVASVAAPMSAPLAADCAPAEPVGVTVMMGTADAVFPFGGGGEGDLAVLGAVEAAAVWAAHNACGDSTVSATDALAFTRWTSCDGAVEVALVAVPGGRHAWQISPSTPTAEVIVPFLLAHRR